MMWWWVKPVRLLSCEVSVRFSQQVPCGVWECLFSDSIMSSTRSLPGAADLSVEIAADRPTSFVGKTTVTSVITESDYTRAAVSEETTGLESGRWGVESPALSRRRTRCQREVWGEETVAKANRSCAVHEWVCVMWWLVRQVETFVSQGDVRGVSRQTQHLHLKLLSLQFNSTFNSLI